MGCFESRVELTPEEAAIVNGENLLLYTNHNFHVLYDKLKQHNQGGSISKAHFNEYASHFKLQVNEHRIKSFYDKNEKDDKVSLKFLITLAVLLSQGTVEDKAKALFETFMAASAKVLGKKGFGEFLDLAFEIASAELPKLAPPPNSSNSFKPDQLTTYIESSKNGREAAKAELTESLFANKSTSVMLARFLEWAQTEPNGQWFSSVTLRRALKQKGKASQEKAEGHHKGHHESKENS